MRIAARAYTLPTFPVVEDFGYSIHLETEYWGDQWEQKLPFGGA
jgi:hypothetical protein